MNWQAQALLNRLSLLSNSRVVDTIGQLKAIDSTKHSRVFVTGYYAAGDGGGGEYWFDTSDTSSLDDGGTVILAADGARWKLIYTGMLSVRQFGARGDNLTDDKPAFQACHDAMPADGGTIWVPNGVYKMGSAFRVTKRGVILRGASKHAAYIIPATTYSDTAPVYVLAFSCEIEGLCIYSPSGSAGYGVHVRGAGDAYIHDNVILNGGTGATGYGICLTDKNEAGTFVPGSYRHRITGNQIGIVTGKSFQRGISTGPDCTSAGMNACLISENWIISDEPVLLAYGGGNRSECNLYQSATGGNSGSRPFSGGVGKGLQFGGELHSVGDYFERFAFDFYPTHSAAVYTINGHTSDASNEIFPQAGYALPSLCETGDGVSAERLDWQVAVSVTANGQTIPTNRRLTRVQGNGAKYTGILLSTSGAKAGQLLTVHNESWPLQFDSTATQDLSAWGSQLILGQQGVAMADGLLPQAASATFMFTESGAWRLISVSAYSGRWGGSRVYSFSGNGETLPTNDPFIQISGGGAARTGALLASGKTHGQELVLFANSWAVSFAAGAAVWGAAGAPTMGNAAGQVVTLRMVYTASGWVEVSRTVRP